MILRTLITLTKRITLRPELSAKKWTENSGLSVIRLVRVIREASGTVLVKQRIHNLIRLTQEEMFHFLRERQ